MKHAVLHVCTTQALLQALGGFAEAKDAPSRCVRIDMRNERIVELLKAKWRYKAIAEQVSEEFPDVKCKVGLVGCVATKFRVGNGLKGGRDCDDERPVVRRQTARQRARVATVERVLQGSRIAPPTREQLMGGR